jgi:sterol 24-C-methyltransferase
MHSAEKPGITTLLKSGSSSSGSGVAAASNEYLTYFEDSEGKKRDETEARRKNEAMLVSNAYYDLATDFYEYGWGESFHFAALRPGESREHSSAKHEYYLALKMQLKKGQRILVTECNVFISGFRF